MRHRQTILIITQQLDHHANDLIILLQSLGHHPVRLHPQDLPTTGTLSANLSGQTDHWQGRIQIEYRQIALEDIRSIWWRRPQPFELPPSLSEPERDFARGELDHAFHGLLSALDCYWVSFPPNIRQASRKLEQLQRAAKLGFEIPATLVTSDQEAAREFYEQHQGQIIYKALSNPMLSPKIVQNSQVGDSDQATLPILYTTPVLDDQLAWLETVRLAPCLFQERLNKQLELRVTVIGDELFAAEIHSQSDECTRLDWRHYEANVPFREAQLPLDIAERCLAFVKSYGLNYSALDLILTPDGRYIFLENNPNGQFLFVQMLVPQLKMKEALAACLIRGANS